MMITAQQKAFYKTFSQHDLEDASAAIEPKEVILITHIAYKDIFEKNADWFIKEFADLANKDFYKITPQMIESLPHKTMEDAINCLQQSGATNANNIIYLYIKNLSELYERRFKFYNMLKTQSIPTIEQIILRNPLEYGDYDDELLFSWLMWRKLIYDTDDKSAQETWYLFKSLIASCMGGELVSHRHSPVKRINENGKSTNEGRQVDCYIEEKKEVYELKLRVAMATNGQRQFDEEMNFLYETKIAGLTPILIVFDGTISPLLEKLKSKYLEEGGRCYIGDNAWNELIDRAGNEMGKYIMKYIKPPILHMESTNISIPTNFSL